MTSTAANSVPQCVSDFIAHIERLCGKEHKSWAQVFRQAFANTIATTVSRHEDGTTFLRTGDIPAMWLRDSSAQVRPYLAFAKQDSALTALIEGLVEQQFAYITIDPYANAFNERPDGSSWNPADRSDLYSPWLWERKYEVDSLCYPVQLSWLLYRNTGETKQFNAAFVSAATTILDIFELEQDHERSPYFFIRQTDSPTDTLCHNGRGNPVAPTGMTWSGFRPSDDACTYNYLVPSNMFAVVALGYLESVFSSPLHKPDLVKRAARLRGSITKAIEQYAIMTDPNGRQIYAYEVDGLGGATLMDDANIPNLISAPYLGFCTMDDPIYLATRSNLLSSNNPFFIEGSHASGIGSSHTSAGYIWPMALAMEGLTTADKYAKEKLLNTLVATDAGTNLMHEGFDANDPNKFTRPWFSWANMMFCELVMDYFDIHVAS